MANLDYKQLRWNGTETTAAWHRRTSKAREKIENRIGESSRGQVSKSGENDFLGCFDSETGTKLSISEAAKRSGANLAKLERALRN